MLTHVAQGLRSGGITHSPFGKDEKMSEAARKVTPAHPPAHPPFHPPTHPPTTRDPGFGLEILLKTVAVTLLNMSRIRLIQPPLLKFVVQILDFLNNMNNQ